VDLRSRIGAAARRHAREPGTAVVAVGVALVAWGVLLDPLSVPDTHHRTFTLPWWAIALLSAGCELVVLHIKVRREAHAISLSELATTIGLFFCSPHGYLAGRLLGTFAAIAWRRQPPLKTLFNCALFVAEASLSLVVFDLIWRPGEPIAPLGWTAVTAATVLGGIQAAVAVTVVIALVDRELRLRDLLVEPLRGSVTSLGTTCVALVCVHALQSEPLAIAPIAVTVVMLLLGFRAYSGLSERHLSLERLYRFSHVVGSSPEVEEILLGVLQHAQQVLRADRAEVVFVSPEAGSHPVRVEATGEHELRRHELDPDETADPVWARVVAGGAPLMIQRGARDPAMRAFLASRGIRDAVLAPLRGEAGVVGTILVGDRLGEVRTFDEDDVRLLETVANHASMALQNGQMVHKLRHDAMHDPLTGLPNRAMFNRALSDAVADVRARRSPGLTVMIMDLVGFKQVNDTLGHQMGDQLLREVAVRLAGSLSEDGVAARLGGDEFAVLLPGIGDPGEATERGQQLRLTLEHPVRVDGVDVEVGVSIGLCQAPQHGLDGLDLIRRADAAMYEAKHAGTGLRLYESGLEGSADPDRLALVGELRHGIAAGELVLHLQPQACLADGRIVGAEALVRWQHPRRGLMFPDEFIPMAERSGLIRPLTTAVLERSLELCGGWWKEGRTLTVAVNLSTRSIVDAELIETVQVLLARNGLPPAALCLEITESSIISDPDRTIAVLQRLHDLGVRLSIDDFGTGYTSLSYLRRLPVQEVKVDKSFVMSMHEEGDDAAIVRSIIDLAGHLGLEVVAEGVEDGSTWDELRAMGCDLVQGYHLARPMPAEQLTAWMDAHQTTSPA
jgi:diguanylate cyclase (GGDEF)-like protein